MHKQTCGLSNSQKPNQLQIGCLGNPPNPWHHACVGVETESEACKHLVGVAGYGQPPLSAVVLRLATYSIL